LASATQLTYG
jgi:hypothetical protein